jgi:type IV fimbrial biogenesis protein FimT
MMPLDHEKPRGECGTRGHQRRPLSTATGFSLIEAMITVAVAAILLAVAAPSFSDFIHTSRLAAQSNDIIAALNLARSEALRLGRGVVFCRSEPPSFATCIDGAGAWEGWMVFVDADPDADPADNTDDNLQRDEGEAVLRSGPIDPSAVSVSASSALAGVGNRVPFRPDGFARAPGATTPLTAALGICKADSGLADNARTVFIAAGSRIVLVKGASTGCTAPADAQP